MKAYIVRRGSPDFVVDAPTIADAIIQLWMTGEAPRASYRVHFGRRREARTVSAAVAYWRLDDNMRSALYDVLEQTASDKQFNTFCQTAVEAGQLLGF